MYINKNNRFFFEIIEVSANIKYSSDKTGLKPVLLCVLLTLKKCYFLLCFSLFESFGYLDSRNVTFTTELKVLKSIS